MNLVDRISFVCQRLIMMKKCRMSFGSFWFGSVRFEYFVAHLIFDHHKYSHCKYATYSNKNILFSMNIHEHPFKCLVFRYVRWLKHRFEEVVLFSSGLFSLSFLSSKRTQVHCRIDSMSWNQKFCKRKKNWSKENNFGRENKFVKIKISLRIKKPKQIFPFLRAKNKTIGKTKNYQNKFENWKNKIKWFFRIGKTKNGS